MIFLVSLVALLLGVLIGTLLRARYIRQGVIDDLSPKLSRMQGQLNTIEAELAYMVSARYAEVNARPLWRRGVQTTTSVSARYSAARGASSSDHPSGGSGHPSPSRARSLLGSKTIADTPQNTPRTAIRFPRA